MYEEKYWVKKILLRKRTIILIKGEDEMKIDIKHTIYYPVTLITYAVNLKYKNVHGFFLRGALHFHLPIRLGVGFTSVQIQANSIQRLVHRSKNGSKV